MGGSSRPAVALIRGAVGPGLSSFTHVLSQRTPEAWQQEAANPLAESRGGTLCCSARMPRFQCIRHHTSMVEYLDRFNTWAAAFAHGRKEVEGGNSPILGYWLWR